MKIEFQGFLLSAINVIMIIQNYRIDVRSNFCFVFMKDLRKPNQEALCLEVDYLKNDVRNKFKIYAILIFKIRIFEYWILSRSWAFYSCRRSWILNFRGCINNIGDWTQARNSESLYKFGLSVCLFVCLFVSNKRQNGKIFFFFLNVNKKNLFTI